MKKNIIKWEDLPDKENLCIINTRIGDNDIEYNEFVWLGKEHFTSYFHKLIINGYSLEKIKKIRICFSIVHSKSGQPKFKEMNFMVDISDKLKSVYDEIYNEE